jgi:hypothetical protein
MRRPFAVFQEWSASWGNLVEVELLPVAPSRATADLMARLDAPPEPDG